MKQLLEKLPFYNQAVLPYHYLQSIIAGTKHHWPGRKLRVIAVTGTNGKTTTCFMIWQMLNSAGRQAGLITTVAWGGVGGGSASDSSDTDPDPKILHYTTAHMTTPDVFTLNQRIANIQKAGAEFLVLEVTSHALVEFRTLGIPVEIAVFTNLTHEHLDYHKTFANYRAAKGKLFQKASFSILNADDSATKYYKTLTHNYSTYGIKHGENRPENIELQVSGVKYLYHGMNIEIEIPGEFNVYNSLAACLVGEKLGFTPNQITHGLKSLKSVEGRMTKIDAGQPYTVIVDYAHAPDALEKVFASVKNHSGRIISVHGGAGRRDPSTRSIRGEILAQHSDIVIITEDDSRDEDPVKIARAFIKGAEKHGKILGQNLFQEMDRQKAIELALKTAKKGDLVLILGKGHEKTILRADGPHDFNDIEVTRDCIRQSRR